MVKIAWQVRRRTLLFVLLTATLAVLYNLTQLYIAPEILARVEQRVPLTELFITIGFFTAALFLIQGVQTYVEENSLFSRVDVRSAIIDKINETCNLTSYPNTMDEKFIGKREKVSTEIDSINPCTEHIWQTLSQLLKNIGGLLVYLTILSRLNAFLLLVVIATCIAGFFVSGYANNWRYAHREEEERYYQKKSYIRSTAESVEIAKDIRMFGLQNWLDEILGHVYDMGDGNPAGIKQNA